MSPGTEPLTTEHTNLSMPLFSVLTDVYGTTLLRVDTSCLCESKALKRMSTGPVIQNKGKVMSSEKVMVLNQKVTINLGQMESGTLGWAVSKTDEKGKTWFVELF